MEMASKSVNRNGTRRGEGKSEMGHGVGGNGIAWRGKWRSTGREKENGGRGGGRGIEVLLGVEVNERGEHVEREGVKQAKHAQQPHQRKHAPDEQRGIAHKLGAGGKGQRGRQKQSSQALRSKHQEQ